MSHSLPCIVCTVLKFCSTATRSQRRRPKSRPRRSALRRPVDESSFWTLKEAHETSRWHIVPRMPSADWFINQTDKDTISAIVRRHMSTVLTRACSPGERRCHRTTDNLIVQRNSSSHFTMPDCNEKYDVYTQVKMLSSKRPQNTGHSENKFNHL